MLFSNRPVFCCQVWIKYRIMDVKRKKGSEMNRRIVYFLLTVHSAKPLPDSVNLFCLCSFSSFVQLEIEKKTTFFIFYFSFSFRLSAPSSSIIVSVFLGFFFFTFLIFISELFRSLFFSTALPTHFLYHCSGFSPPTVVFTHHFKFCKIQLSLFLLLYNNLATNY